MANRTIQNTSTNQAATRPFCLPTPLAGSGLPIETEDHERLCKIEEMKAARIGDRAMTRRVKAKLRIYPDPILKAVCEAVGDDEDVSDVIRDMMHILTNSKTGVGLAAPQAGHTKRVIVVCNAGFFTIMVNPVIIDTSRVMAIREEGCLSYPGKFKQVERHTQICVEYQLENGRPDRRVLYDFQARICQHEIDHLDGKCKIEEQQ